MQWYPEVTGQCLCHNVNIEFVHARHEEFLLATYRGSGTMRQEIRLDIVFHERLELFDDKQLFDARGKLPDPVERQRIGETYLEHSSRKPKLLQGINDIVERAAHCNDPTDPPTPTSTTWFSKDVSLRCRASASLPSNLTCMFEEFAGTGTNLAGSFSKVPRLTTGLRSPKTTSPRI